MRPQNHQPRMLVSILRVICGLLLMFPQSPVRAEGPGPASRTQTPLVRGWYGFGLSLQREPVAARRTRAWLYVRHVIPSSPADRAAVRAGDAITHLNGRPVWFAGETDAIEFFASVRPGQTLAIKMLQKQQPRDVRLVAAPMPPEYAERGRLDLERAKAARTPSRALKPSP